MNQPISDLFTLIGVCISVYVVVELFAAFNNWLKEETPGTRHKKGFILPVIFSIFLVAIAIAIAYWLLNDVKKDSPFKFDFGGPLLAALAAAPIAWYIWTLRDAAKLKDQDLERDKHDTDRFTKAVEMLGTLDKDGNPNLEVRLGAIYALERIGREVEGLADPIRKTLAAYVRQNAKDWRERALQEILKEKKLTDDNARENYLEENPDNIGFWRPEDIIAILQVVSSIKEKWKEKPQKIIVDFDGCDLRYIFLEGIDLSGLVFSRLSLFKANLYKAYLEGANLRGADLAFANLEEANLMGANLEEARLVGANLTKANLTEAKLTEAKLKKANLTRATLTRANLNGANLNRANLEMANLEMANLKLKTIELADFTNAIGLTWEQIDSAELINTFVYLPDYLMDTLGDRDPKIYRRKPKNEEQ